MELERSVRAMEANVLQLEAGNVDADDSETKQKYENQRQLNVQLQEQKRWLEHELEQVYWKFPLFSTFSRFFPKKKSNLYNGLLIGTNLLEPVYSSY